MSRVRNRCSLATLSVSAFFISAVFAACSADQASESAAARSLENQSVSTESVTSPAVSAAKHTFNPQAVFEARCAHCHDGSVPKAPHQIKFQLIGRAAIHQTLTSGLMKVHANGLDAAELDHLADYLGGTTASTAPIARCSKDILPAAAPALAGWSLNERGTRFVPADISNLSKSQVPNLALKWVFAYPGATRARSQPAPFGDALLVGSQAGTIYALDLATGCAHWTYQAEVEVRSAIAINNAGTRAYFGDIKGNVYAINPRSGSAVWKVLAHEHPDTTITGSPRLFKDTLYVPLSSTEWGSAADPGYACCTFRGGVVALDTVSGDKRWTAFAIEEEPALSGATNELGVGLYHPAGAPIWNSPTIDEQRNQLYVGTGEAYTSPAADTSDSVLAFDLTTGERRWAFQALAGDAWNMACFIGGGANCPEEDGPDQDIGAPPMLVDVDGTDVVIAGQKSGDVFALNPDNGQLIWRTKVGRGGFAGGVHWGMAAENATLFIPNADTTFTGRFKGPRKPGLFALNAKDGAIKWFAPAPDVCAKEDKPACDPGFSAAATATQGLVFAGAFDGHLRAYDSANGDLLWDFNTHGEFGSVSGETAIGGSIEADGPVLYRGNVIVNSGYLFGDRMAGNALMVFAAN